MTGQRGRTGRYETPIQRRGSWTEEPESPCGERFAYSNVGYTIVGHIVETLAGVPYEVLMAQKIFAPLELESAGFRPS